MNIDDLAVVGRLGRKEPGDYYHVMITAAGKEYIKLHRECFLVFNSDRVFFVTVDDTKTFGKRMYYHFQEDGVAEEFRKVRETRIALAKDDLATSEDEHLPELLTDFQVSYQDEIIGRVSDALINPMQSVMVIILNDGRELLVPQVEHYVKAVDGQSRIVYVVNLELLLELCT